MRNVIYKIAAYSCFIIICLFFTTCTHKISALKVDVVPDKLTAEVKLNSQKGKSFQLLYLGCGHMIIQQNNEAFFTDPFFSVQPIPKLFIGRMHTKKKYQKEWHSKIQNTLGFANVQSGLISHSHYDHLMDLPAIIRCKDFPNLKTVYGNDYLPEMLSNFKNEGVQLTSLTDRDVFDPNLKTSDTNYQWMPLAPHMRVLPIITNHAPQIRHHLFMNGKFKSKPFKNHLCTPKGGVGNFKWVVGTSYAFLVDMIDGPDTTRLYIQTSASHSLNGLPPAEELKAKKVDLMILCYASTQNEVDFPGYLINTIKDGKTDYPKIIMIHWEDFFARRKDYNRKQKLVALTNPHDVLLRWQSALQTENVEKYITMPRPGTLVTVMY